MQKHNLNFSKSANNVGNDLLVKEELEKGGALFSFFDMQYDIDKAYRMINSGEYIFEIKSIPTYEIKHRSFNKKYSDSLTPDFSVAQGLMIKLPNGNDLLIDGNHRMNKAFTSGLKEMLVFYIDNSKTIKKFSKKIFAEGGKAARVRTVVPVKDTKLKILYLHGLGATPESDHVKILYDDNIHIIAPTLDFEKSSQFERLCEIVENVKPDGIVGHSMGADLGFLLSNKYQIPCLVFNPVFDPKFRGISSKIKIRGRENCIAVFGVCDDEMPSFIRNFYWNCGYKIYTENMGHDVPDKIKKKYFKDFINKITKEINISNFHEDTSANFELICYDDDALEKFDGLVMTYGLFHESDHPSTSKYVFDSSYIFRLSDHWGQLESCKWMLVNSEGNEVIVENKMALGKCLLDKFYKNENKESGKINKFTVGGGVGNKTLNEICDDFNYRIREIAKGGNKNYKPIFLGMPSDILLSCGFPYLPIEMTVKRLTEKKEQQNHKFTFSSVIDMPEYIGNPIAVFQSKTKINSKVILTEMTQDNVNMVVAIETKEPYSNIFTNSVRSLYQKDNIPEILSWICEHNLMEYVDKKKVVDWLSKRRSNCADVTKLINHTTNVVQNFENPKNIDKKMNGGDIQSVTNNGWIYFETKDIQEMKTKLSIGGRLMTPEEIKTSAIRDVITIPQSQEANAKCKFCNLSELQATAIYDTFSDYENMASDYDGETLYEADNLKYQETFLGKEDHWIDYLEYFETNDGSYSSETGEVYLKESGIEFINAVRARINTITAIDNETDMFPSEGSEPKFVDRQAILDHLYKEHHDTWAVIDDISLHSLTDMNVARFKVVEFMNKHLKSHFEEEEEKLFPLIINDKNSERIKEIIEEHKKIVLLINKRISHGQDDDAVEEFVDMIKSHIKLEEKLFSEYLQDPYGVHVSPEKNILLEEVLSIQIHESNEIPDVVKYDITTTNPLKKKFDLPIDSENREAVKKIFKGVVGTEKEDSMRPNIHNVYAMGNFMAGTNAHIIMFVPCSYIKKTFLFHHEIGTKTLFSAIDDKQKKKWWKDLDKKESEGQGEFAHVWDVNQETPEAKLKKRGFFAVMPKYGKENFQSEVDVYELYDYLLLLKRYPFPNQTANQIFFNYEFGGKKTELGFNRDLLMVTCEKFIELGLKSMFVYMSDPNRGAMFCQHALPEDVNIYKFVQKSVTILLMPVMGNDNAGEIEPAAMDIDFDRSFYPKFNFKTGQFADSNGVVTHPLKTGSLLATYDFDITLKQFKAEWNRLKKDGDGNVYYKANHMLTTCIEGLYEKVLNKPKSRLSTHQRKLLLALNWLNFYKNEVK